MSPILNRRDTLVTGVATLLCLGLTPSNAATSRWRRATALPIAVQEIYPTLLGGRIHLAGGLYAEDGQVRGATKRHFSWAPGDASWAELASLPQARHHPNLVGLGSKLFALGGFDTRATSLDWTMSDETLIYDPETDLWLVGPPSPEAHGETVCVAVDQRAHVIGGRTPQGNSNLRWTDHVDSNRHLIFDTGTGSWTNAAPALVARNSAAGVRMGGTIHVVGGRQVGGGNLTQHEVYDIREDRWRVASPMPQGQGGLAAAALDGRLYAFGGEFFDNNGGVYAEAWCYLPDTDEWTSIANMPTPRHGLGAVTLGEEIFVIGGAEGVGGDKTSNTVEAFRP